MQMRPYKAFWVTAQAEPEGLRWTYTVRVFLPDPGKPGTYQDRPYYEHSARGFGSEQEALHEAGAHAFNEIDGWPDPSSEEWKPESFPGGPVTR